MRGKNVSRSRGFFVSDHHIAMLKLPESLKTISSLFITFSSFADDSRVVLSTVEPIQVAGLVFLVLLTVTSFKLFSFRSKRKDSSGPSKSLQALSCILTPTCTSWPRDYTSFLEHSACTKLKTIRFSFSRLFSGICMGDIEIRDFHDLPCLLNGQLRTYGWDVYLGVDLPCRSAVLRWIAISQTPATKVPIILIFYVNIEQTIFSMNQVP